MYFSYFFVPAGAAELSPKGRGCCLKAFPEKISSGANGPCQTKGSPARDMGRAAAALYPPGFRRNRSTGKNPYNRFTGAAGGGYVPEAHAESLAAGLPHGFLAHPERKKRVAPGRCGEFSKREAFLQRKIGGHANGIGLPAMPFDIAPQGA